jgi:uncharacterized membrane protein YdfJ with MMPL/SSD domain
VPGADVLSAQSSERQGLSILQRQFPALPQDPIYVVVQAREGGSILAQRNLEEVDRLTTWTTAQQHFTSVTGLTAVPATPGTPTSSTGQLIALYSSGNCRHVPALAQFVSSVAAGDTTVIVAQSNTTLEGDQGKALIEHLRADAPAVSQGLDIRVGGLQALSLDLDSTLYRNFPRTNPRHSCDNISLAAPHVPIRPAATQSGTHEYPVGRGHLRRIGVHLPVG